MLKRIKNILITWDGLWSIPVAGVILMLVSGLLLELNPTADVIGIGMVQDVFTAAFRVVVGNMFAQVGLAINVFLFFGLTVKEFKLFFDIQKTWVKFSLIVGLYACYLLAFVLALP
jgi:hypothetical protein